MAVTERTTRRQWPAWLQALGTPQELPRLLALMGLFFLVVCALGILRPIKNALALDGIGATDFYQVYLVSAVVVLFVPLFFRLVTRERKARRAAPEARPQSSPAE